MRRHLLVLHIVLRSASFHCHNKSFLYWKEKPYHFVTGQQKFNLKTHD
jgi:hypothetical protein